MEFLSQLELFDYLALGMIVISLFQLGYGIDMLYKANPEQVDRSKLRGRALSGLVLGVLYIFCHLYVMN